VSITGYPVGFGGTGPGPAGSKNFGTGSKIFGPGPGTGRDRFQNPVPGPTSSAEAFSLHQQETQLPLTSNNQIISIIEAKISKIKLFINQASEKQCLSTRSTQKFNHIKEATRKPINRSTANHQINQNYNSKSLKKTTRNGNAGRKREKERPFLTSSVPNWALTILSSMDTASSKFNFDGRFRLKTELTASESGEKVGFFDSRIPNQHHFEQVIIIIICFVPHF